MTFTLRLGAAANHHCRRRRSRRHSLPRRLPPRGHREGRRLRRDHLIAEAAVDAPLPIRAARRPLIWSPRTSRSPTRPIPPWPPWLSASFRYCLLAPVVARSLPSDGQRPANAGPAGRDRSERPGHCPRRGRAHRDRVSGACAPRYAYLTLGFVIPAVTWAASPRSPRGSPRPACGVRSRVPLVLRHSIPPGVLASSSSPPPPSQAH